MALLAKGDTPLMFAPDGLNLTNKLDCIVEPTLYLLYQSLQGELGQLLAVYVK